MKIKTSEYTGVHFDKARKKWIAACKCKYIGAFETGMAAALAYDKMAKEVFGKDYSKLNFKRIKK